VYDCVRHQVRAGGIEMVHLSLADLPKLPEGADPIEELLTEEKREMLVTAASDNGWYVEPYPLSDKKLTKAFKRGLWKLMETLLEKVKHEILFDKVLMPWLLEWLMICSQVHASAQHGAQHGTQPLCACRNRVPMLMLAVQPPWSAPHRRRVCDGGLRAARAHRQGAKERTPECGAAEQWQAAQGCEGSGACQTRRSPVHAKCSPRRMCM
jgi:hypothetical protein